MADLQPESTPELSERVASRKRPFVGLRPFGFEDAEFYFGREEQIDALERLLLAGQLITVVGSSGSGKSSLVLAGLLPHLMSEAAVGSAGWDRVEMRPGESPIRNLAEAFAHPNRAAGEWEHDDIAEARADRIELRLLESSFGIRDSLDLLAGRRARQLVILVDQFEEIFRFADLREHRTIDPRRAAEQRDEVTQFIQLLLTATNDPGFPGCIILTMRSDFIGECARFHGLSEAVTRSQYLVPALTRDQRAIAVRKPIARAGGNIEPPLVQRLLNETNEDLDQLPVLQHAMMRCWQHAASRQGDAANLTLDDYGAIGGIENALTLHANELLDELRTMDAANAAALAPDNVARRVFQCLTDTDGQGRTIRRPQTFGALVDVIVADDASPEERAAARSAVRQVIAHFSNPDCSFLRVPPLDTIEDDTVIDIGHEALIRRWELLGGRDQDSWVRQEQHDSEQYRALVQLADLGSPIEEQRLPGFQEWWRERRPNRSWARRYSRGGIERLDAAREVLTRSEDLIARRHEAEAHTRVVRRRKLVVGAAVLFFIALLGGGMQWRNWQQQAEFEQQQLATAQKAASDAEKEQARLVSMLGMEALRLVNPDVALLVAKHGLDKYWSEANPSDGADVPELYQLAYAALQQLREQQIIRVANSFLSLAFDRDGNLLTFFNQRLHKLGHQETLQPTREERNQAVGPQIKLPFSGNLEPTADGTIVLVSNGSQTYVIDPQHPENTQELMTPANGPGSPPASVGTGTISRDGNLVLTTKRGDSTRLWMRKQDKATERTAYQLVQDFGDGSDGTAVAISATKQFLAVAELTGTITIYQVVAGTDSYRKVDPPDAPKTGGETAQGQGGQQIAMVSFEPTEHPEQLLVAYGGGMPPRLYRWRDRNWTELHGGRGAFRPAFSPDGSLIAAPSPIAREVDVWRTASIPQDLEPWLRLHSVATFFQVAFDRQVRLAAASMEGTVWLWDLRASALSRDLPDPAAMPPQQPTASPSQDGKSFTWSRNGTSFTCDQADKHCTISSTNPNVVPGPITTPRDWNPPSPSQGATLPNKVAGPDDQWALKGADVSPDGTWLALTPNKGLILLYDLKRADRHLIAAFGKPGTKWSAAAFLAEAPQRIVATPQDGPMIAWRYFDDKKELTAFTDKALPLSVDLTALPTTNFCQVNLANEVVQELNGDFWPVLVRDMGDGIVDSSQCLSGRQ